MRKILISLMALAAMGAGAQEVAEQIGVPSRLEVINGKVVKVLLQQADGSNITFRVFNTTKDITVNQSKIKSLTFYPKYEPEVIQQKFNDGDYDGVVAALEPVMEPYCSYMAISNNMQSAFCLLMEAYQEQGNFPAARKFAEILLSTGNADLVLKGQVNIALVALADGDLETAETLRGEVASEAAGLYLQSCIERAQNQPKAAIQTATDVIAKHGNDMDWLPPTELLCARLYLDMAMTNSADSVARQVQKLYTGTHIAKDAERLRSGLVRADVEGKAVEQP